MLKQLPFIETDVSDHITSMWRVTPTGHYGTDFATGRDYFNQLVEFMHQNQGHLHLQRVLQAIVESGDNNAIVTGFVSALSMHVQETIRTIP